jgi:hypothetical protein
MLWSGKGVPALAGTPRHGSGKLGCYRGNLVRTMELLFAILDEAEDRKLAGKIRAPSGEWGVRQGVAAAKLRSQDRPATNAGKSDHPPTTSAPK